MPPVVFPYKIKMQIFVVDWNRSNILTHVTSPWRYHVTYITVSTVMLLKINTEFQSTWAFIVIFSEPDLNRSVSDVLIIVFFYSFLIILSSNWLSRTIDVKSWETWSCCRVDHRTAAPSVGVCFFHFTSMMGVTKWMCFKCYVCTHNIWNTYIW